LAAYEVHKHFHEIGSAAGLGETAHYLSAKRGSNELSWTECPAMALYAAAAMYVMLNG